MHWLSMRQGSVPFTTAGTTRFGWIRIRVGIRSGARFRLRSVSNS